MFNLTVFVCDIFCCLSGWCLSLFMNFKKKTIQGTEMHYPYSWNTKDEYIKSFNVSDNHVFSDFFYGRNKPRKNEIVY